MESDLSTAIRIHKAIKPIQINFKEDWTMKEQSMFYTRECKEYKVNTEVLVEEIRKNVKAGRNMIHYVTRYMDAALTLSMYDMGDRTFDMVENGRDHYEGQAQLWLSKTVNCIMYFQSCAKLKRVFNGLVRRDDYFECIDLVSSVFQALMEFFHVDFAEEDAKVIPIGLPMAA